MVFRTYSTITYICVFIYTLNGVNSSVCLDGTFTTTVIAQIYDNQTKGEVIYTYPETLNESLTFESTRTCDGIQIQENKIVLLYTKDQMREECEKPSGECIIMCNPGNVKGSFFRKRIPINQKGPTFNQSLFDIDITENMLLNSTVYEFKKGDIIRHDCFDPKSRVFSLSNDGKQAFDIIYPGRIILRKQLDYEADDHRFLLNITLNNSERFAYTTVQVNVKDVDDMDPAFYHDNYTVTVTENVNNSMWMKTTPVISAHDRDTGSGKQEIKYSLYDIKHKDIFDINATTGEIKIMKVLDREKQSIYHFKIKVYQRNDIRRSATANLNIIVLDQNDKRPIFDQQIYRTKLDEHSSKGTLVTRVHANDEDTGDNAIVDYSIVTSQTMFKINQSSGEIFVNDSSRLDRENLRNSTVFTVRATDSRIKGFTDDAKVEVTILDRNDNSPVFTQNVYFFNATDHTEIGQINATDRDNGLNGNVEYFIDSAPSSNIQIDKYTGRMYSSVPLHDDTSVRVKVCDSPQIINSRRCTYATVYVHASFQQSTNMTMQASVMENMPVGTYVGIAKVPGSSYEIQDNRVPFSINSVSGVISTRAALDYDNGHTIYTFRIHVLNKAKVVMTQILMTVTVLDTNDNQPEFTHSSYVFSLPDIVSPGFIVGSVQASDRDSGNNSLVHYRIQNAINSHLFQIDVTGKISVKVPINDGKSLYQIYVIASDNGIPSLSSFVEVLITRVNIVGTLVKIGTPLQEDKLLEKKNELESKISAILKVKSVVEEIKGVTHVDTTQLTRSHISISGQYKNGSNIPASHLQLMVLNHIVEIQSLFGNRRTEYVHVAPEDMSAAEIALIAISGVIFLGSILLIIVIRRQWRRTLKFERLHQNLMRKSSLYESQELKVRLDDETSDYAGSLNTQEVENSQNSNTASLDATAFSNPVYESVHGPAMTISRSTIAATNEALESLQDLTERLNKEDKTGNDLNELGYHSEQTFVKEFDVPRIETSVEYYEDVDMNGYSNFEFQSGKNIPKVDSTNLMKFESNTSLCKDNSENEEYVFDDTEDGTIEPSIDYNDKQVRFSSIVLDTEEDIFKPLKEETISPAHFEYNSDGDERDGESMGSSFPDLTTLIRHSESDETDRADEEINSPIDFLKVDEIRHNPADHGTFHFGFNTTEQNETTKF